MTTKPNLDPRPPQLVLSLRLARMQEWIKIRAPWVFIDKEMELIMKAFERLQEEA